MCVLSRLPPCRTRLGVMQIAGELRKIVMTDHTGTERGVDMTPEEAQAAETKPEALTARKPKAAGAAKILWVRLEP